MQIEVVYALANEQTLLSLEIAPKTSVKDGIIQSGILDKYSQINLETDKVGIFGKITTLETLLREKDRIEIYRPLIADPKEARRKRAEQGKQMRRKKDK